MLAAKNLPMLPMLACLALLLGGDWPQFRGPQGNGVVPASPLPRTRSETENVAWKIAVPGHGWSQPIVIKGGGQLDDVLWATPAVAGDSLLLCGVEHLSCLRAKGGG